MHITTIWSIIAIRIKAGQLYRDTGRRLNNNRAGSKDYLHERTAVATATQLLLQKKTTKSAPSKTFHAFQLYMANIHSHSPVLSGGNDELLIIVNESQRLIKDLAKKKHKTEKMKKKKKKS